MVPAFYITSHKLEVCNSVERASLELESGSTASLFAVFCSSESNSYRRSVGCLTSERMQSRVVVSVTEPTFSHESGRRFQRLKRETANWQVSDLRNVCDVDLFVLYVSVYFICAGEVCVCRCTYISSLIFFSLLRSAI